MSKRTKTETVDEDDGVALTSAEHPASDAPLDEAADFDFNEEALETVEIEVPETTEDPPTGADRARLLTMGQKGN